MNHKKTHKEHFLRDQNKTLIKQQVPILVKLSSKKSFVSFTCSFLIQILMSIDGETILELN